MSTTTKVLILTAIYISCIIFLGLPAWTFLLLVLAVIPFVQGYRSR